MDTIEPLFARMAGKQGLTEKTAKWFKGSQVVQRCSFYAKWHKPSV